MIDNITLAYDLIDVSARVVLSPMDARRKLWKMKILIIDPWGVKSTSHYTNGLCYGVSKYNDLTLATNYYYKCTTDSEYMIRNIFFRRSEVMKPGKIRSIVRGLEYIRAYIYLMGLAKKEQFDIIEIEWLLFYKIDANFIKALKKYAPVIYKAHNVLPHEHGESKIDELRDIYRAVDGIVLHGESIKEEFIRLFPEINTRKVYIQHHGTYINKTTEYDISKIPMQIVNKMEQYDRKYIFFGSLFYNKGVDRLIDVWRKENFNNSLLIIAGKIVEDYYELKDKLADIAGIENVLLLDEYVENNTLDYLIANSSAVLITYRHASMSGVLFTAAEFAKPILCTDTGSLKEYFLNDEHGYLVENSENGILTGLKIMENKSDTELETQGEQFKKYIFEEFSWTKIARELQEVFKAILMDKNKDE